MNYSVVIYAFLANFSKEMFGFNFSVFNIELSFLCLCLVIKILSFGSKMPRANVEYAKPVICARFSFHIFFFAKSFPCAAISL